MDDEDREAIIATFRSDGGGLAYVIGMDHLERSHCYTFGWSVSFDLPELIAFGTQAMVFRVMPEAFDAFVDAVDGGIAIEDGACWPVQVNGHDLVGRFVDQSRIDAALFDNALLCRDAGLAGLPPAYQLFWADEAGRYPWQEGCSDFCRALQPLLYLPLTLPPT
ncbi:DUF4262 domain-containing protein [Novosphingobium soli]|uniref:DUF4262 domain-containing protein n=1 Tax=Novosphingobium soli TaxID=574956 RepID=A0ABV6CYD2_9SPHN